MGKDGAEAVWLIVQHAILEHEFQKECVSFIEQAVEKEEANSWHLAYLQDRVLVQEERAQVFGTQHVVKKGKLEPLPIEDFQEANSKRVELGLWSLEGHTAYLQRDYDSIQRKKAKADGASRS